MKKKKHFVCNVQLLRTNGPGQFIVRCTCTCDAYQNGLEFIFYFIILRYLRFSKGDRYIKRRYSIGNGDSIRAEPRTDLTARTFACSTQKKPLNIYLINKTHSRMNMGMWGKWNMFTQKPHLLNSITQHNTEQQWMFRICVCFVLFFLQFLVLLLYRKKKKKRWNLKSFYM